VRRLAYVAAITLALVGFGSAPAWADNGPHSPSAGNTTVDRCAGCHRAHTAQASYLLKAAQPALCYTCHGAGGNGASTDVQDGVGYSGTGRAVGTAQPLRGGGFDFALINSTAAVGRTPGPVSVPVLASGQATTSSHSVDGSPVTAWGNTSDATKPLGAQISLRCGSCHDPHGNGNYRILRPVPEESGVATTAGVTIADSSAKVYTTTDYWKTDDVNSPPATVSYVSHGVAATATTTQFIANISAWCTTCHNQYLAGSGSYQTSSGDAKYTYRHRSDQNFKAGGANCITCHVAHGSNADMTGEYSSQVAFPDNTVKPGDSKLLRVANRGTCEMCHSV
jgi:predicted CXXCH cytochrome family protein